MPLSSFIASVMVTSAVAAASEQNPLSPSSAFGFPSAGAQTLCDTADLRVRAWSNNDWLYVQAIMPGDNDDALGETDDGREIGDSSTLILDVDADGKPSIELDRTYTLNAWPSIPGLYYQTVVGENMSSGLSGDSKGRGAISYVELAEHPGEAGGEGDGKAKRVRVDTFLIPLAEIARKPGDHVRIAYYGHSTKPELTVNSVGYKSDKKYYPHSLPTKDFHDVTLVATRDQSDGDASFNPEVVPDGRAQVVADAAPLKPMPEVGAQPPEVNAEAWLNWKGAEPPSLASLRGKVVVVEFWATWCGPCVAGIPHLNKIHDELGDKGLVILSLTDQKQPHVEQFLQKKPMHYTVGVHSKTLNDYGVSGIPQAFVINRKGVIAWRGHPANEGFEESIREALGQ